MGSIEDAKRAYRMQRLYDAVSATGRLSLTDVTRKVIRDSVERQDTIDALVTAGKVRVEITQAPSGRGRVDLVKAG